MLQPERIERLYLHRAPIDMRRQRNGLAALVQQVIRADPFINRSVKSHEGGGMQGFGVDDLRAWLRGAAVVVFRIPGQQCAADFRRRVNLPQRAD